MKTGAAYTGMALMIAGDLLPTPASKALKVLGTVGKMAMTTGGLLSATFGSAGLSYLESSGKAGGITEEDKQEILKEVKNSVLLTASGMLIGKVAHSAAQTIAQTCPKLLALASEIGIDGAMSLVADLAITGEIDCSGEGIAQLTNILVGIIRARGVKNFMKDYGPKGTINTPYNTKAANPAENVKERAASEVNTKNGEPEMHESNFGSTGEFDVAKRLESYPKKEVKGIQKLLEEDADFAKEIMKRSDADGKPVYSLNDMQQLFKLKKEYGNDVIELINRDLGNAPFAYPPSDIAKLLELKKKDPKLMDRILKTRAADGSLRFIAADYISNIFECSAINKQRFEYLMLHVGAYPMYSSETFLALCKMKDSRYNKMVDSGVFELIKEGKLSAELLSPIRNHTYMSDRLLGDIKKIKNNEPCVPTLPSGINLSNISKYVADGDVCSIDGKLYINNNGNAVKLNITPEKYEELFPILDRYNNYQGNIGDCYLISALDALMDKPAGKIRLLSLIKQEGNDIVIKFPNDKASIVFKDSQVFDANGMQVSGAKGLQMFEQAYFIHKDRKLAKQDISIDVMEHLTDAKALVKRIGQGGQSYSLIEDIIGVTALPFNFKKFLLDFADIFKKEVSFRERIENIQNKRDFIGNYNYIEHNVGLHGREFLYYEEYDLYSPHAYTIKAYDKNEDMVYLTNPHYTGYITEIPYTILTEHNHSRYFASLNIEDY